MHDTITAFQGRHVRNVRRPAQTSLSPSIPAVCPVSLLPSHYPAVSSPPPAPHPSLPQIPPHLPLSDTQRGRSPSLSVPAGKHMLLFPSDSGVWERRDCLMFINHLSVVERGDGDRATHTHIHTKYLLACIHTRKQAVCLTHTTVWVRCYRLGLIFFSIYSFI